MLPPREVPTRDEFYMGEAFFQAAKSKDPNTQVGARIVSHDNQPLGTGYNGPPRQMDDFDVNWSRPVKDSPDWVERVGKYPYMIHAEDNAIKRSKRELLEGATIYVTAPPCRNCMMDIVECGIRRVVFFRPKGDANSLCQNDEEWLITQDIAQKGRVELEEFDGDLSWMCRWFQGLQDRGVFRCGG